jgi:hypothetical protein
MDLEDVVNRFILSDTAVLERVDEWTLYCRYLGFQPTLRTRYRSSIRTGNSDDSPSFSIFASNMSDREYAWKDSGGRGTAGEIFKLIQLLHAYPTVREAWQKVDVDFKLGFGSKEPKQGKIVQYIPPVDCPSHIAIKSKPHGDKELAYWLKFGIDSEQLKRYQVSNIDLYWLAKEQQGGTTPQSKLCFAYQIMGRYQLYQPFAPKDKKFRNNLTDRDLHGFHQLKFEQDTLIITKARKDVMCLDMLSKEIGAEFVAPRSETTLIAPEYLRYLETKYKRIFVLFDNDGKHRATDYPYPNREIPIESGTKDPAEFREKFGRAETIYAIKNLIK